MNDFVKIFQEAFELAEPLFYVFICLFLAIMVFKMFHNLIGFGGYSLSDLFSDIKESIFY